VNGKARPTVIKKNLILPGERTLSAPAAGPRGLRVRTETVGADVTGLVIKCGCGEEARIECVYDGPPPASAEATAAKKA
jgi:hypothetical protein